MHNPKTYTGLLLSSSIQQTSNEDSFYSILLNIHLAEKRLKKLEDQSNVEYHFVFRHCDLTF